MASDVHSWEWDYGHEEENMWKDLDTDCVNYEDVPAEIAQAELCDLIVQMKLKSVVSAKQACELAFWAKAAGAQGPIAGFALPPNKQTGKYSRQFDHFLGSAPKNVDAYNVAVVRRIRVDASRRLDDMATIPPHEHFAKEFADVDVLRKLEKRLREETLPPFIADHPSIKGQEPGTVHPIAVYLDGVSFQRQDSVFGLRCYHVLTGRRHLISVIRRSETCTCGCSGWCTLHPVFDMIRWSLQALQNGHWPDRRHDGALFDTEEDHPRLAKAGSPLGFKAAPVLLKGDWAELHHTIGLPSWKDRISPCPWCMVEHHCLHECDQVSPLSSPYPAKTDCDNKAACRDCEVHVRVDAQTQLRIRAALAYNKGGAGPRGRILRWNLPDLGLAAGDRLDPSPSLNDIGAFDYTQTPFNVVFWRSGKDTTTKKRNPIFENTGLTIENLGIDALHAISLGVHAEYLKTILWELILANAWKIPGGRADIKDLTIAKIGAELLVWYSSERRKA